MPGQRNEDLKYTPIHLADINEIVELFYDRFAEFLTLKGFPPDVESHISFITLVDIIVRVDKRKAYYYCFHGMQINECKETSLYAYWILKLRPFTVIDERFKNDIEACCINESFVIYFIGFMLEAVGRIKRTKDTKESYTKFLKYSFRFRNFSIDSFIVLVESISTETLEKEYPDLSDPSKTK
jgi:hypothetical protein